MALAKAEPTPPCRRTAATRPPGPAAWSGVPAAEPGHRCGRLRLLAPYRCSPRRRHGAPYCQLRCGMDIDNRCHPALLRPAFDIGGLVGSPGVRVAMAL